MVSKIFYDGRLVELVYRLFVVGSVLPYFVYQDPIWMTVGLVSGVLLFAWRERALSIIAGALIALLTWNAKEYHWYMHKYQMHRRLNLSTWYFLKSGKMNTEDLIRWHKADDAPHKKAQFAHLQKFQRARSRS